MKSSVNKINPLIETDEVHLACNLEPNEHAWFNSKKISLLKGYIYTLVFAFCSSCASIFIKLSVSLTGSENSTIRYLVQLIIMSSIILIKKESFFGPKEQRLWLIARGLVGSSSVILGYFALKYIDPSDYSTLNNCSVIVTAIMARIFLKEKLTSFHLIATILSLCGIFFILRPPFLFSIEKQTNLTNGSSLAAYSNQTSHLDTTIGVILVVLSALSLGITHVIIKKLCIVKVHYSVVSFYPALIGIPTSLVISLILFLSEGTHQNLKAELTRLPMDIFFSIVAALLGSVALIWLNMALDLEDANRFAIIKTTDVLFSFLLQFLILNIKIDLLGVIGALFILTSTYGIYLVKLVEEKNTNSIKKNKFLNFLFYKF